MKYVFSFLTSSILFWCLVFLIEGKLQCPLWNYLIWDIYLFLLKHDFAYFQVSNFNSGGEVDAWWRLTTLEGRRTGMACPASVIAIIFFFWKKIETLFLLFYFVSLFFFEAEYIFIFLLLFFSYFYCNESKY